MLYSWNFHRHNVNLLTLQRTESLCTVELALLGHYIVRTPCFEGLYVKISDLMISTSAGSQHLDYKATFPYGQVCNSIKRVLLYEFYYMRTKR